ncbi:MAG: helix-turn-helix transcriptional regulator [Desulfoprunum sp.]|nr:helix-turn-helix transcriptional regulator [Desulfoprunum sp.]
MTNPALTTDTTVLFQNLQGIADAIVGFLGRNCEVCIHDLTSLQKSLIYIAGNVTGRKPGAPATDLLVRTLQQQDHEIRDLHNYRTTSNDGRSLKSTTIFIRDSLSKPVAAFCINFDTTEFFNASQMLLPFINNLETPQEKNETFARALDETIESLFSRAVLEVGKQPFSMSMEEKTKLIEVLERDGAFRLKGAVEQVAVMAGVSKYTVYNYLKKIRARQTPTT